MAFAGEGKPELAVPADDRYWRPPEAEVDGRINEYTSVPGALVAFACEGNPEDADPADDWYWPDTEVPGSGPDVGVWYSPRVALEVPLGPSEDVCP